MLNIFKKSLTNQNTSAKTLDGVLPATRPETTSLGDRK
jgi:hypothetical protein